MSRLLCTVGVAAAGGVWGLVSLGCGGGTPSTASPAPDLSAQAECTDCESSDDRVPQPSKPEATATTALDKAEVSRRINEWLDAAPARLSFEAKGGTLAYSEGSKSYAYHHDNFALLVNFERPLPDPVDAAGLQQRFKFVVVDEVPPPIETPGWRLRFMTPVSSTEEGFAVESYVAGVIKTRLDWKFFSIYAEKLDRAECPKIADASTPEACFVSIDHDLPFVLTLDATFSP